MRASKIAAVTAVFATFAVIAGPGRAADATSPEALAISKTILEATHASALGEQMLTQIAQAFTSGMDQANPGKDKEVEALLNETLVAEFRKSLPDLMDQSAQTYANNFTLDELKQILAFYQSDIGRKMVERQPKIIQDQAKIGQTFAQTVIVRIREKLLAGIKARGLQKPDGL